MDALFVGIDVSKDRLDVALRPAGECFAIERTAAGIEWLIERLRQLSIKLIAIEATGGFESIVAAGLAGAGLPVLVVNPAQVRAFAQALGKRAKTDPIDATVIARFVEATKPQLRPFPNATTQLLSELVARRRQIVEMIAAESQCARQVGAPRLKKSIARLQRVLQKELTALETEISDHIQGSPVWAEKEDLLASVPGIGPTIARSLIADLPELGRSIVVKSLRLPALHHGRDNPVNGAARALSAAADRAYAEHCSWAHW